MTEPTNKDRAERIRVALEAYAKDSGCAATDEMGDLITDALSDIRHLCDRYELAFHELDRRAYKHYSTEVVEQRNIQN